MDQKINTTKSFEAFQEFYETSLLPELKIINKERWEDIRLSCYVFFGFLILFYLVIGFLALTQGTNGAGVPMFLGTFIILTGIFGYVAITSYNEKFSIRFRECIIKKIVAFVNPDLIYEPKKNIDKFAFEKSEIFTHASGNFMGQDLVHGNLGDTSIRFSKVRSEYKKIKPGTDESKETHWRSDFNGLFFIADFNKNFKTKTVVLPDTTERLFGFIGKKLQSFNKTRAPLIKLEDVEFEKYFVVYGEDQVEARYILSPDLMSRITDFRKKSGRAISLSFVDSCIYIAFPAEIDLFEPPGIFYSPIDFYRTAEYYEYLSLTIGIVDDLHLNTRIWNKIAV